MRPEVYFGVLCLISGGAIARTLLSAFLRVRRSRGWTRTEGRILSSELNTVRLPAMRYSRTVAAPCIRYTYTARGRQYEGTRVNFFGYSLTRAKTAVERYQPGTVVPVWYDPDALEESVLERSETPESLAWAFLSWFLLACAAALLWRARRLGAM